jgi:hypothetical protein
MATKQPTVGVDHPTVVPENYEGGADDEDAVDDVDERRQT